MPFFLRKSDKNMPRRRQQPSEPSERINEAELEQRYAFRRNRTLTGSASSQVVSLNEGGAQLKSPRVHAHELATKRRHIGGVLLLVVLISAILFMLISQFTARVMVSSKDKTVSLDSGYDDIIQSYLNTKPIERLRFLTNQQHLTEYVQTKAPEVAFVQVNDGVGFGRSQFTVEVRHPIAGWSVNGHQQYVDGTGTPFTRNYYASPSVEIVDKSGIQVEAGQAVASNRFLAFVGRVVGLMPLWGYSVTQVIIPASTTHQIEVMLQGVKYPIKLSIDRAAGEQAEDTVRVVKWMTAHNSTPQYADVRIGGKAYYR